MLEDDNVWNDKNTEDYLRWHKYESFKICFQLSFLVVDILISGLFWHHGLYRYGPIEFSKIGAIFIILVVHRLISMLVDLFVMKTGMSNKIYVGTSVLKLIVFILLIIFLQTNVVSGDKVEDGKNKYYGNML